MMNFRPTKLSIVIAACAGIAYTVPVWAQTLKKEPDANQLSCGQKVLVETTRVRRIKFCKLPAAVSVRHLRLIWCELQGERNTTV